MSKRHVAYTIAMSVLTAVTTVPPVLVGFLLSWDQVTNFRLWGDPSFVLSGTFLPIVWRSFHVSNPYERGDFLKDRFFNWEVSFLDRRQPFRFEGVDPETGTKSGIGIDVRGFGNPQWMPFGDRLWMIDWKPSGATTAYEVVDGNLLPSLLALPPRRWPEGHHRFLLKGEPAYVEKTPTGFAICSFNAGKWSTDDVVLPDLDQKWVFAATRLNFRNATEMVCLDQGDRIHVILQVGDCVLYREGLDLTPAAPVATGPAFSTGKPTIEAPPTVSVETDRPASAIDVANPDGSMTPWSLVVDGEDLQTSLPASIETYGTLIDDQPAILLVQKLEPGRMIGFLYRSDGTGWSLLAKHSFQFGTDRVRVVTSRDRGKSYVIAGMATGAADVFVMDAAGMRLTQSAARYSVRDTINPVSIRLLYFPLVCHALGIFLGLGTWLLMWLYTVSEYRFGMQTVRLASLGRRAIARLIDAVTIVGSTVGLGWFLTIGFDWTEFLNALELKADHPTIPVAIRVVTILGCWLAGLVVLFLFAQGRWGITPGKWCCGLRTVRTTFRPCGFMRSLVREITMSVDTCNMLCWTPGIVSIAFTSRRQRLGDLVADTIVIETRSA